MRTVVSMTPYEALSYVTSESAGANTGINAPISRISYLFCQCNEWLWYNLPNSWAFKSLPLIPKHSCRTQTYSFIQTRATLTSAVQWADREWISLFADRFQLFVYRYDYDIYLAMRWGYNLWSGCFCWYAPVSVL